MAILGRESTVGQLLSNAALKIRVPRHQRPYSWESTELRELWSDLTSFDDRYPLATIAGRQYFLGGIVAQTKVSEGALEVLDGQQRLASLTILLAALRDVLYSEGQVDLAHKIQVSSLTLPGVSLDSPDEYILQLGKTDDVFFRNVVLAYPPSEQKDLHPKTASQLSLQRAKSFFASQLHLRAVDRAEPVATIAKRLYSIVTQHLTVVVVSSDSFDDVTDIFERLNDRGKGLSTLDLLRVYLIGRTSSQAQADVEDAWAAVYELSQSAAKVDAFLRHSWITLRGDVKSRSLYKEIKSVLDAKGAKPPLDSALAFSQSLESDAELYRDILEAKHPDDKCQYWLRAISTLGATSLLPVALAGFARGVSSSDLALLLERTVGTFVRWNVISSGESTVLEEAVFPLAQAVRAGVSVEAATSEFLSPLLRSDEEVVEAFKRLSLNRAGYQRYILEALEDDVSDLGGAFPVEKPVSGSGTVWVEHIYPQSPDEHWGKWEAHDTLLNRMGNLTLLHKKLNGGAKNKTFPSKKPYYSSSGLKLNEYFDGLDSWSPADIDARQAEMACRAPFIWRSF